MIKSIETFRINIYPLGHFLSLYTEKNIHVLTAFEEALFVLQVQEYSFPRARASSARIVEVMETPIDLLDRKDADSVFRL